MTRSLECHQHKWEFQQTDIYGKNGSRPYKEGTATEHFAADSRAGTNWTDDDYLRPRGKHRVNDLKSAKILTAMKALNCTQGSVPLSYQNGYLQVQIWFIVVQNLAVNVLPRTEYIHTYIRGILLIEQKIVAKHSAPVAMLRVRTEAKVKVILSHKTSINEQKKITTIQAAKCITSPAETESSVVMVIWKCAAMTIEQIQMAKAIQCILPTQSIHEVCTQVPFRHLVTKLSKKPVGLHQHTCTAFWYRFNAMYREA